MNRAAKGLITTVSKLVSVGKSLADFFAEGPIGTRGAVEGDGGELFAVDTALFVQNALLCADVYDIADADTVLVEL